MFDEQALRKKIKRLSEAVWEGRAKGAEVDAWLKTFVGGGPASEQAHMLYLLSNFLYFGVREIRELLQALFRNLCERPLIAKIRNDNDGTTDLDFIDKELFKAIHKTRFLAVGNPSESGHHLLYYFRQENKLPSYLFPDQLHLPGFPGASPDHGSGHCDRYIFLDDLCGTGVQVVQYASRLVSQIRSHHPQAEIAYYPLFATSDGLEYVQANAAFSNVGCMMLLDPSFRCFSATSRIYDDASIRDAAKQICLDYGRILLPKHPLGYQDGQLAVGFSHNTPDNCLPVFWRESSEILPSWSPIFRRYSKQ
jgi:hypothetical protein